MKNLVTMLLAPAISVFIFVFAVTAADFIGQFEPDLVVNKEEDEQLILKNVTRDKLKGNFQADEEAHLTAGRLIDPRTKSASVIILLIEERGESPFAYVDLNGDGQLTTEEKLTLNRSKEENPFLWEFTAPLKNKEGTFKTTPIFVQYYKSVKREGMAPEERLVTHTTAVMARAKVDIKGKPVIFQYGIDAGKGKVDAQSGWLGVDMNGDGNVDLGKMSPESTKANEESVIFRVGETYVSTKKADVSKNQVIVVEREAKDYKRAEIYINKPFPNFSFTDFDGKKRNFSEFKGKYVLLDIWGFWCPPCRVELPYIREAHRRYGARNFEILGLNTDEDFTVDSMKKGLKDAGMVWTNAQFASVVSFLRQNLRINSYPTTFLIDPDGNVTSIGRSDREELSLRGRGLLESLEKALPVF